MSARDYFADSGHEFINRWIVLLCQNSVDCLKDAFKIFIVVALPWLPLTEVLDVVDRSLRVCVSASDFLVMVENIVARGWSSALVEGTSIELTNLAPL